MNDCLKDVMVYIDDDARVRGKLCSTSCPPPASNLRSASFYLIPPTPPTTAKRPSSKDHRQTSVESAPPSVRVHAAPSTSLDLPSPSTADGQATALAVDRGRPGDRPRRRPRTARRPPSPSTADGQANALAVDRRRPGDRGRPGVAAADAGLRRPAAADVVELLASRRIPLDGGGVRRHVGNVGPAAV